MIILTRRCFAAGVAASSAGFSRQGWAQSAAEWPSRPVTVIMPLQAGSASDIAVRFIAEAITQNSGIRFTVENVTGAAGMIGAGRAAGAAPDGYTLGAFNNSILTILPNVQKGRPLAFDPFTSFVPVCGIATIPTFLGVHKDVPVRSVPELIAYAKQKNGELNYASGGGGSPQHLATEMFMAMSGARMTQVAYRGATAAATDLAGGHVQVMFIAHSLALPFLDDGNIRFIGYGGPERHDAFLQIPTVAEQGVPGYDYSSWIALFAVKGTPEPVLARLRAEGAKALAEAGLRDRLAKAGLSLWAKDPNGVAQAVREDDARWKKS